MHTILIISGILVAIFVVWFLLRTTSDDSLKTTKTVLSSDTYTKVLLTIIAGATSIMALQGFLD